MLWQNILGFDLDYPLSEYGFSTRLETENCWTSNFTKEAIIEYKKFMYLATISDSMVSPSEIVDIVWHQHLVFTESYERLCNVLGKKIAHIPSTHNRSDYDRFKQAKDHTQKLYKEHFGDQPAVYWEYPDIYGPLMIKKSRFRINKVNDIGLLLFLPVLSIAYFLLRPVYVNINNPFFVLGYIMLIILIIARLNHYNHAKFTAFMKSWDRQSFMSNLSPSELIYLKGIKITEVIDGIVNQLVSEGRITVLRGQMLTVNDMGNIKNPEELCVMETIKASGKIVYSALQGQLMTKPIFKKTVYAMEGYRDKVRKSSYFVRLFTLNFGILSLMLLLGVVRIVTGIVREKPVIIIILIVLVYLIVMCIFLYGLKRTMGSSVIIQSYKEKVSIYDNWEWQYFLLGTAVFVPAFIPVIAIANSSSGGDSGGDSGGSSGGDGGGSSCGSSCGGGCGGCGS